MVIDPVLEAILIHSGVTDIKSLNGKVCGLTRYFTTFGLVVGFTRYGYERRYCYSDHTQASNALATWDGKGHAPGNWLKVKGTYEGQPIDLFNPNLPEKGDW